MQRRIFAMYERKKSVRPVQYFTKGCLLYNRLGFFLCPSQCMIDEARSHHNTPGPSIMHANRPRNFFHSELNPNDIQLGYLNISLLLRWNTFEWVSCCCCCWFTFYMLAPYCLLDGGDVCVCMVLTELHRSKFILGWYARATDDGFPEQKWRNLWIEVFQWISSRIGTTCNVLPMARGASWIFLRKMTGEIKGNNCIDEQRIDLANVSYHSYCSLVYCSNALNSTTYFTNSIYGINSKWNSTTINLFCIIIKRHIVRCSYRYTTLFTFLLKKYTHTHKDGRTNAWKIGCKYTVFHSKHGNRVIWFVSFSHTANIQFNSGKLEMQYIRLQNTASLIKFKFHRMQYGGFTIAIVVFCWYFQFRNVQSPSAFVSEHLWCSISFAHRRANIGAAWKCHLEFFMKNHAQSISPNSFGLNGSI